MEKCRQHSRCQFDETSALPDRILDIGRPGQQHVRLRNSENLHGLYVALSYCWGRTGQYTLMHSNVEQLTKGINIGDLPQTVQDAIFLAWGLGCCFLWVDALCIVQGDAQDWEEQSAKMDTVYKNAHLVIMASRAAGVSEGFLDTRCANEACCGANPSDDEGRSAYLSYSEDSIDTVAGLVHQEPLTWRGWAMQERELAKRKVYFTSRQMLWQCQQTTVTEGERALQHLPLAQAISNDIFKACAWWLQMVGRYTMCDFTNPSDRVVAISGLAREFGALIGDQYLAGHWRKFLLPLLLWSILFSESRDGETQDSGPSWSWLATECRCNYILGRLWLDSVATIVCAETQAANSNAFGRATARSIAVSAPVIHSTVGALGLSRSGEWIKTPFAQLLDLKSLTLDANTGLDEGGCVCDFNALPDEKVVDLVILCRHLDFKGIPLLNGLIVAPVAFDEGTFTRVGVFHDMLDFVNEKTGFTNVRII